MNTNFDKHIPVSEFIEVLAESNAILVFVRSSLILCCAIFDENSKLCLIKALIRPFIVRITFESICLWKQLDVHWLC